MTTTTRRILLLVVWSWFLGVVWNRIGVCHGIRTTSNYPSVSWNSGSIPGYPSRRRTTVTQPRRWSRQTDGNEHDKDEISLGTTLVAIRYQDNGDGGVVVAADTRTSISSVYVSHRFSHKIQAVTPYSVILRSGSAADTQQLVHDAQQFFQSRYYYSEQQDNDDPPTTILLENEEEQEKNENKSVPSSFSSRNDLSIAQLAHWLRYQIVNNNPQQDLAVSLIIAGYNPLSNQGELYTLAPSGALIPESTFAVAGSGSTFILGYLNQAVLLSKTVHQQKNQNYDQENENDDTETTNASQPPSSPSQSSVQLPTREEAIRICHQAVSHAIQYDGSSGGMIRMVLVSRQGTEERYLVPVPTT